MSVFDKVKKVVKKVVKGVKKVFKKVVNAVVKFLNSKIGKAIMLAATVITAGAALYGAYAGMTGALAQSAPGFAAKFSAGFKGALAGLKTGAGLGQKALGQAAKLNFSGAKETLMSVGGLAKEAGGNAILNLAKNAAPVANAGPTVEAAAEQAAGAAGAPSAAAKGTVGGLLPPGTPTTVSGTGVPLQQSPVVDLANSASNTMAQTAGEVAKTAGQTTTEGLLTKLIAQQDAASNRLLWGNVIGQGAQMYGNYNAAQAAADAEEEAVRRGWARDSSFNPLAYV